MIRDSLITNNNKIIFLILDGFGDTPNPEYTYQTQLEAVKKSNIDNLSIKTGEQDGIPFYGRNCINGSIGTIYSKQPIPLVLTNAFKLDKYGAQSF